MKLTNGKLESMSNRNESQENSLSVISSPNNALETMLSLRVDISTVESEIDPERINAISFELYKEALSIVNVTGHIFIEEDGINGGWLRNQAICASLIIRMAKFMLVVAELSAKRDRADIVAALNRSIMESAINLEFLAKASEDAFNRFVVSSLGPERELYDLIQANIQARQGQGEMLPIERRMLDSINDLCRASGITIDEVKRNAGDWAGGLRERVKVLGKESQYVAMVRLPSHAVHGTWVDLYKNLRHSSTENRFTPKSDCSLVDERLLGPVAVLTLEAIKPYVARFFDELPDGKTLLARIDDLRGRLLATGAAHERLTSAV